jgi:hypothetical protein
MKLTVNEAASGFTDIIILDAADLVAIGTGGTKLIATVPPFSGVELVGICESADLMNGGSANTDLTVSVGTTLATPTEYLTAGNVYNGTPVFNTGSLFYQSATTTIVKAGSHPVSVSATAVPVYAKLGGTVSSLTAGRVTIGLRIVSLFRFNQ